MSFLSIPERVRRRGHCLDPLPKESMIVLVLAATSFSPTPGKLALILQHSVPDGVILHWMSPDDVLEFAELDETRLVRIEH